MKTTILLLVFLIGNCSGAVLLPNNISSTNQALNSKFANTATNIAICSNPTTMIDEHDYSTWENYTNIWNVFTQNGYLDTGNHELANFDPANVSISNTDGLILTLSGSNETYKSGKIALKKPLIEYAPEHGYFIATISLPKTISYNGESNPKEEYVQGYWPLLWLLPTPELTPAENKWANGGEIDLLEMMEQGATGSQVPSNTSTMHFGPVGGDAWYIESGQQHWGYVIGTNKWNTYSKPQTIIFEWNHISNNNATYWTLNMYVDGQKIWTRNVNRLDMPDSFKDFEQNKTFYTWNFSQTVPNSVFGPGGAGDPAFIFNRAFSPDSSSSYGLHLIFNFAFGGDPFANGIDKAQKTATMSMHTFKLYNCN